MQGCNMSFDLKVGIVIPVLNGSHYLPLLMQRLREQTQQCAQILIIDSASTDDSAAQARALGASVLTIERKDFNHGATRNLGAEVLMKDGVEVLVFMTQDALPGDEFFIANLVAPLGASGVVAAYARQIPYDDAVPLERFARAYNYPAISAIRSQENVAKNGLKAFFFSNVASAIRVDSFRRIGGFPTDVIMNEDMVLCARVFKSGQRVAYCADAIVRHSHNYSLRQQFKRYFDIGAFIAESHEVGGRVGGEGVRFVIGQISWCWNNSAKFWMVRGLVEAATKWLGIQFGKRHALLPLKWKRRCSMHAFYWR
jgi:rhamnosyltransferase